MIPEIYVVMARCARGRPWISGVFLSGARALAYLQMIPGATREQHRIQLVGLELPLFVLEDESGFRFFDQDDVLMALRAYGGAPDGADEDREYATVYRFDEVYGPKVPGADEMGNVWHTHIMDRDFWLDDAGLRARLAIVDATRSLGATKASGGEDKPRGTAKFMTTEELLARVTEDLPAKVRVDEQERRLPLKERKRRSTERGLEQMRAGQVVPSEEADEYLTLLIDAMDDEEP